ncbi:MAG: hypothetical protein IJ786_05175 [Bacteroidaceae bacterium]|nr:hypothetical protein [Bacteroidaceae bacterium]
MKKEYIYPYARIVSILPEKLIALSSPKAYPGEDEDERAPQGTRGFDWENNESNASFWNN